MLGLNSPLDHTAASFLPLILLIALPMAAGLPILSTRLGVWARHDAEKARIVNLLADEGAIDAEAKQPVKEAS